MKLSPANSDPVVTFGGVMFHVEDAGPVFIDATATEPPPMRRTSMAAF